MKSLKYLITKNTKIGKYEDIPGRMCWLAFSGIRWPDNILNMSFKELAHEFMIYEDIGEINKILKVIPDTVYNQGLWLKNLKNYFYTHYDTKHDLIGFYKGKMPKKSEDLDGIVVYEGGQLKLIYDPDSYHWSAKDVGGF